MLWYKMLQKKKKAKWLHGEPIRLWSLFDFVRPFEQINKISQSKSHHE
jgi:hypothetical protein